MIYRYGDGYEYPSDARSVPVGMGRKQAVRAGLPELTGTQKYGVAIQLADGIADLVLPDDYDGPALLTGQFVNFNAEDITAGNDRLLLFVKGKPFLRLDNDSSWTPVTTTYPIDGDIAISAYGRVWVTGVGGDYHTIHYSALLDETKWYTTDDPTFNDAGVIDVREYWPVDGDSIVNIHAHNGYLLVFGRNSILVYANADAGNPAGILNQPDSGIFLQDAISNVGLVRRDAICNIGTDVLFVDDSGVRSIGRVIQEKSNPLQEPSLNIRREVQQVIQTEVIESPSHSAIKLEYLPSESLAVLLFASLKIAYVFHLNMPSKTGGMKVTRWTDCFWNDSIELKQDQRDVVFLAGKPSKGLMKYDGYFESQLDGFPEPYVMRYESMALALGQSPMQKVIPKSIHYVCMGEFVPGQANALWGFSDRFIGSREFQIDVDGGASEYAVNEFGSSTQDQNGSVVDGPTNLAGYYPMGGPYYKGYKINTTGSGELFRVGFEVKVQGGRYALQEIDINSAIGRAHSMSWLNWIKSDDAANLGSNLLGLAGSAGSIYGALDNANDTRDMGNQIQTYLDQMGTSLDTNAQFQGYGVTSGLGSSTVGTDGSVNLGVGQYGNAQNAADAAYGAATNFANQAAIPVGQRQDDIYQSIMATQNPELNRMQAEQQAAEYARGRGGVRGSQYGGTAEDAAMARARAQASNQAAFQAREMANTERGMLGQLAGQFGGYGNQSLQASYLPMQQQMALLGLGQQNSDMAQTGQLTGLDYMAQLGLGGANANINAMHSANQLTGNLYNALLSNIGGVQGENGSAGSGLLGAVGGAIGSVQDFFGPQRAIWHRHLRYTPQEKHQAS